MFTKIDIKNFGLYKDFIWPANLPEMSRINIIYGRNYSGKTTLSRIFDGISLGQLHKKYSDGSFSMHTDDDSVPEVTEVNMNTDCPYSIRVYNSDYVRRNLGWLNDEDAGEIKPFALIGSDNVKAQQAIDIIDEELGSVEEKKGLLYAEEVALKEYKAKKNKYDESTAWLENQLRSKANNDIKKKNLYVRQGTNYNVNNIKGDIEEFLDIETIETEEDNPKRIFHKYSLDDKIVLNEEEKQQLEKTVEEALKVEIKTLHEGEPHLKDYEERIKELVTKKITLTKTLQELVDNDLLQAWVAQGMVLNKDRETCAFCGSPITKERWDDLAAHFSKESEEMKNDLQTQKQTLEEARKALDDYLPKMGFTKENIYVANIKEYERVIVQWNEYVEWYKKEIDGLLKLIDERLVNIFKPIEYKHESTESCELIPILKAINALIVQNNQYGLKLENEKGKAREKLRLDYVYQFCTDIHYTETMERIEREEADMNDKSAVMLHISSEIGFKRKDRKQKELDKKDEGKAAKKVTTLLVNHFGNGSLSLEPETVEDEVDKETGEIKPRTRFVVKRGTDYAFNLSDGEKSLISFCYFIAQMDDELKGPEADKLVIFIDDPISSLDSSHIFFMYSLIDTMIAEPKKYGQLFISTHNLDFLKFLKRIKLPGGNRKKELAHYVVEKLRKGDDDYKCVIEEMPKYLKDYVTEYNFLFEQIYEMVKPVSGDRKALISNTYTQYYNVANDMRKFLECYLFYRYPDTNSPLEHLNQLFEGVLPSAVNRVVNEYSHLAWAERGLRVIDVPEMETAAKHIMRALKEKDQVHFETLCKSIGGDKNVDLSLTA